MLNAVYANRCFHLLQRQHIPRASKIVGRLDNLLLRPLPLEFLNRVAGKREHAAFVRIVDAGREEDVFELFAVG